MFSRRRRRQLRRVLSFSTAALILNLCIPTPTHALPAAAATAPEAPAVSIIADEPLGPIMPVTLPDVADKPQPVAKKQITVPASAYSSTVDQTDADPWTTASGSTVHAGTVAANCLPFGTKIRLPEQFGDKIFTVEDRMHPKWGCDKIDIWMTTRDAAIQWGVQSVLVEIL